MTKAARKSRPMEAVSDAAAEPKQRRKRRSAPVSFAGQLRELVVKHRAKLQSLVDAEAKLEAQLADVRRQREAAEGPLREVEAALANHPELPGEPSPLEQPPELQPGEQPLHEVAQ